ncbi:MAG: hypothetical protein HY392_00895 [Candidatus Diapherotrites archaeon]|nr:hypothetical protein [Candidatus Diapherotrites archaeon]
MTVVLNFQKKDIPALEKALGGLEGFKVNSMHEHARFRDKKNVVVVYTSGKTVIQGSEPEKTKAWLLEKMGLTEELALGFDEVGRGEGFGPMVIAGVFGDTNKLREVRDSKKTANVSDKFWIVSRNALSFGVFSFNAEMIDRLRKKGFTINEIEEKAIDKTIELFSELGENPRTVVDGNQLKLKSKNIEFVVAADDLEPVVGSASIVAGFMREKSGDAAERKTWKKKSS